MKKIKRQYGSQDIKTVLEQIIKDPTATKRSITYLYNAIDSQQLDYIMAQANKLHGKIKHSKDLWDYENIMKNNPRYYLLAAILIYRNQLAGGYLPNTIIGKYLDEKSMTQAKRQKRIPLKEKLKDWMEEIDELRNTRDIEGNLMYYEKIARILTETQSCTCQRDTKPKDSGPTLQSMAARERDNRIIKKDIHSQ